MGMEKEKSSTGPDLRFQPATRLVKLWEKEYRSQDGRSRGVRASGLTSKELNKFVCVISQSTHHADLCIQLKEEWP